MSLCQLLSLLQYEHAFVGEHWPMSMSYLELGCEKGVANCNKFLSSSSIVVKNFCER